MRLRNQNEIELTDDLDDTFSLVYVTCLLTISLFLTLCGNLGIAQETGGGLFSEEALSRGVNDTTDHMFLGSGLSFYDWDKDGWPDISLCKTGMPPRFYHNDQGNFSDVQFNIPNTAEAKNIVWVDYDNDGDADVFLTRSFAPWSLYQNDGNFNFTDVTASVGISQIPGGFLANAKAAAWSDINRDGFLDLYIANYHASDELTRNLFFLNNGGASFSEMAVAVGIDDGYNPSFQPVFFDADMDGWPDLHVINDRDGHKNSFYRNNGNLTFTNESQISGLELDIWSMSNSPGDHDNDGDLDLYVTNRDYDLPTSPGGNFLFQNDGNAMFANVAGDTAVQVWVFSWGAQWIDQNLDGYLDLFVSTSPLNADSLAHSNHFARNNGNGSFEYRPDSGMEDFITKTYCAATGDFDNDGAPDLALTCKAPFRNELWKNNSIGHTYIKISLEGVESNRDAIGSTVRCYSNGVAQLKYTTCGEAYLSQNSQYLIYGLNGESTVDSVTVDWPSGIVDRYYDLQSNQTFHIVEGSSSITVGNSQYSLDPKIKTGPAFIEINTSEFTRIELYDSSGRLVSTTNTEAHSRISTQNLKRGIYVLRWIYKNGISGSQLVTMY